MKTRSILITSFLAIVLFAGCGTTIPGGYNGLMWQRYIGVDTTTYTDGFKWHWPFSEVILYDMRWKTQSEEIDILSSDDLHMTIEVAIRLKPRPNELYFLHQEVGPKYYTEVVQQQFRTIARTTFAQYKYNEIAKKSVEIENTILSNLRSTMNRKHLDLDAVEIKHVDYPSQVKQAADAKLATEQRLMQKEFDLKIAEKDATIKVVEAKGQQRAQKIIDSSLTQTYLQYRALEVQRALVNSSNSSFFFVPTGQNNVPIILNAGMEKGR